MAEIINPLVVDLSHWDPADDYQEVAGDGIVGVIYKATEGGSYTDPTYVQQQSAAKAAGLCWGSYHFADGGNVNDQIMNYLRFAAPDPDELFCLDWEDNGGDKMSRSNAKTWITEVERALGRVNQCVIYGGNTIKEALGDDIDAFFGARRLWLCQYGTTPTVQVSWPTYWLWQFTDGQVGPMPHSIEGIGPCDINSYADDAADLRACWATGSRQPQPQPQPQPVSRQVTVLVAAPPGVSVVLKQLGPVSRRRPPQRQREAGSLPRPGGRT